MDSVMEICLSIPSLFCGIRVPPSPQEGNHKTLYKFERLLFTQGLKEVMRSSFYCPVSFSFFLNVPFYHSCPEVLMGHISASVARGIKAPRVPQHLHELDEIAVDPVAHILTTDPYIS